MSDPEAPRGRVLARILVIEDDDTVRGMVADLLVEEGYAVDTASDGEHGLKLMQRRLHDVVLLDLQLPGMGGLEVLAAAPATHTRAEFIVMSAFGTVETAVEAMRLGAHDYVLKPFRPEELVLTIERALRDIELHTEVARLRNRSKAGARARMVGRAPVMVRLFDTIERVAPMRATVLITGETGTGKELVARAIHDLSGRAKRAFVPINCSALPESLLESELFGHVKGSFTGAIATKRGLIEQADGGTLFLDEIPTISLSIQVKLLRVLEERRVQRVGATQGTPVDFRLIAATNVDLSEEVERGRFRDDLFYRLHVLPIRVPPLRERASDVPLLAQHFLQRFAEENGTRLPAISAATLERMMSYDWPGNVRELENAIERALVLNADMKEIRFDPASLRASAPRELLERAHEADWNLSRLEQEYILLTLERTRGHQGRAAEILGIDRRTLYRKLKWIRQERALAKGHGNGKGAGNGDGIGNAKGAGGPARDGRLAIGA
jgi:DNA-binding NtrC family response regulator